MGCKGNRGGNCKGTQTEIRIKKMRENAKLPEFKNGNWMDTYVSKQDVLIKINQIKDMNLLLTM